MAHDDMQRVVDDVTRTLEHAFTNTFGQTRRELETSVEADEIDLCSITVELLHLPRWQKSIREELVEAEDSYRQFPLEALISFDTDDNNASAASESASAASNWVFAYKHDKDNDSVQTSLTEEETTETSLDDDYNERPSQTATADSGCKEMDVPRRNESIPDYWESVVAVGVDSAPTFLPYTSTCGSNLLPLRLAHQSHLNIDDIQNLNSLFRYPTPLYVLHLVVPTTHTTLEPMD